MKFIYRGVTFDVPIAGTSSIKTGEIGMFRGKSYALKTSPMSFHQPTEELVYRGVRYTR